MKHTPLPWHVGMKPGPILYGPKGEQVADLIDDPAITPEILLSKEENRANAAYIVQCCNSFPDLVEALRLTEHTLISGLDGDKEAAIEDALESIRAALKKAGG